MQHLYHGPKCQGFNGVMRFPDEYCKKTSEHAVHRNYDTYITDGSLTNVSITINVLKGIHTTVVHEHLLL